LQPRRARGLLRGCFLGLAANKFEKNAIFFAVALEI
jgi:hypothetical protein